MVAANALNRAILLGFGTGIRSMTPLAMLSWASKAQRITFEHSSPFSVLANSYAANGLLAAAAGELVVDKLPFVPARTQPGPLAGRMAFGALVGAAAVSLDDESWWIGSAVGGTAALFGAFAGAGMRSEVVRSGVPSPLAGVIGDILAITVSVVAVLRRGSTVA